MVQKKVKQLEIHFKNTKQKAVQKGNPTLAEKRVIQKKQKQAALLVQKRKAAPHKLTNETVKLITVMDLWKEMSQAQWTMSMGLLMAEVNKRNQKLMAKNNIVVNVSTYTPRKPYKPSEAAKRHHKYVTTSEVENTRKRALYVKEQKAKRDLKRQQRAQSPNRLVCIQKDTTMLRIRVIDATIKVADEGWKFIPKHVWKEARADNSNNFTLLWEVGRVNLKTLERKTMDPTKVTSRYTRSLRKKMRQKIEAEEKLIRTRKSRKNIKDHGNRKHNIRVIVKDKYAYTIQDDITKRYFDLSKQSYKEAKLKYKTLRGVVEHILKKEEKDAEIQK